MGGGVLGYAESRRTEEEVCVSVDFFSAFYHTAPA